ncbi:MAG: S41 family peptidase, partial [Flavisolibacter sp.]
LDEGNNIEGWVVDLRGDRGGNGHPMVKGLSALIGEGVYAYASFHKKVIPMSTLADQGSAIKLESPYRVKNPSNKIAVLIDSNTGSSGELTAIAFKTLPNVKFFGQPSAGYTTANSTIKLSDGSILFLAIGYMTDRNMNKYIPNIVPDVITSAIMEYSTDPTIAAAKSWLRMK